MKIDNRLLEELSAYVDNELSPEQKRKFEQKLNQSLELRKKLEEYLKLKNHTVTSLANVPDSPFFRSRVEAALKDDEPTALGWKRLIPISGIVAATIILMLVLRTNPGLIDEIVEQQKTNLAGFYSENLKPLFYTANLTNDDIFNFAMYKELPLDNTRSSVIQLGYDQSGAEYFEIKAAADIREKVNLQKFAEALSLNEIQRKKIDSIISHYADDLRSQILVDENNTVAINPGLWNYRQALVADLINFAAVTNPVELRKLLPEAVNQKNFYNFVDVVKESKFRNTPKEYIILTPDSVFTEAFDFNPDKFKQVKRKETPRGDDHKFVFKFDSIRTNIKKRSNVKVSSNFRIDIDSNVCRVEFNELKIPVPNLPDFEEISSHIERITENISSFSVVVSDGKKDKKSLKFRMNKSDSLEYFNMHLELSEFDSLIKNHGRMADSLLFNRKNSRAMVNPDSLSKSFNFFFNDSVMIFNNKEFKIEMKEFREEMNKLRKEMLELRKEINKPPTPEKKKSNPIEI